MTDTIFAMSSGAPPAGIAVIRVSGPDAFAGVSALAGSLPRPRMAGLRAIRDAEGHVLDHALVLTFPGPASATGEDCAELHCHGGRAVVAAVLGALARQPGLRPAAAGEFTRRALTNGRIDLAEASGLADLLSAETERQRRAAMASAEGHVSRAVRGWLTRLSHHAAIVEADLDFSDEDDVAGQGDASASVRDGLRAMAAELAQVLAAPPVERLRDGVRVVLGGRPNSGKSTLINLLAQRELAIVSPIAGTTRDRIEATVTRDGLVYILTDTAGITVTDDPVEQIGVARARDAIAAADLLVWLDDDPPPRDDALWVHARADMPGRGGGHAGQVLAVAQSDAASIERLWASIAERGEMMVPATDGLTFRQSQREACIAAWRAIEMPAEDPLILAEQLRIATAALSTILGIDATEAMLDALFGQFCVGK